MADENMMGGAYLIKQAEMLARKQANKQEETQKDLKMNLARAKRFLTQDDLFVEFRKVVQAFYNETLAKLEGTGQRDPEDTSETLVAQLKSYRRVLAYFDQVVNAGDKAGKELKESKNNK